MDIRFIKQEEIDKTKWNSCVHYAPHGNIFGYKWYLDNVAKDWDGLVEGDYESVFPLIWKNQNNGFWKKNSKVIHQPELIRTAGLYSVHVPSAKRITSFLELIPEEYQQQEIRMSEGIRMPKEINYTATSYENYLLLLEENYDTLTEGYSPVLQQQLERARLANLMPLNNLKPEKLADFFLREAPGNRKEKEEKSHALQRIMYNALFRGWGFASGVSNSKQEILAVNFFLISHKRIMSLMPVESPAGAKVGAMAFLFDMVLRTQSGKPFLLDFNVSEKSELALNFGASPVGFKGIQKN